MRVYLFFFSVFFFWFFSQGLSYRPSGPRMWRTKWSKDLSLDEYVMGEEKFNEKGAGFSSITIKKKRKNKHEEVFSIESKE